MTEVKERGMDDKELDKILNSLVDKTFGLNSLQVKEVSKAKAAILAAHRAEMTANLEDMKPIKGFPNYLVTNRGRIYSVSSGKFLSTRPNRGTRYPQVSLMKGGVRLQKNVHALVAEAFVEKPDTSDKRLCVNHIDGDRSNNHYKNLEWTTWGGNLIHSFETGLNNSYGENNFRSKLTIEQVNEIISLRHLKGIRGETFKIAKRFGVSKNRILTIWRGETWRYDKRRTALATIKAELQSLKPSERSE